MSLGKKGDLEFVQKLILILVGTFIIIFAMVLVFKYLNNATNASICEDWVALQSKKIASVQVFSKDNPCISTTPIIEQDDKYKVMEELANSMFDCWKQYGAGKIDFFSDWDLGPADTHCMICSKLTVSAKSWQGNLDINEFEEFLNINKIPSSFAPNKTYAEYFLGAEGNGAKKVTIDFGEGTIPIKPDTPLYSIFSVKKKREANDFLSPGAIVSSCVVGGAVGTIVPGGGTIVGCGVGIVGGFFVSVAGHADQVYASIFLMPGDDVLKQGCGDDIHYKPKAPFLNYLGWGKGES